MDNARNEYPSLLVKNCQEAVLTCEEIVADVILGSELKDYEKFKSLMKKIENNISSGNVAKASLLSYCYLCLSCKTPSSISSRLVNDLIYGPLSLSVDVTLEFLRILNRKGLPNGCVEPLSIIPLGIIYNLPVGSILYDESLNESLFEFIENLLNSVLTSNNLIATLEVVYQEINTFLSEYSRILGENGLSYRFKRQFERINNKWIRLVSLLSSNTYY